MTVKMLNTTYFGPKYKLHFETCQGYNGRGMA